MENRVGGWENCVLLQGSQALLAPRGARAEHAAGRAGYPGAPVTELRVVVS